MSDEDVDQASDQAEEVQQFPQTTKLCFTTDGYVDTLAQLVEQDRLAKVQYFDESSGPVGEEGIRLIPEQSDEML
ncbi:MAG: hypothetical protein Q9225_005461, partial [Loekoesia sp. 1 TL-2023]